MAGKPHTLVTIGYEGRSQDDFLDALVQNKVEILVDVRRNPISRKSGFSKKALSDCLEKAGVKYMHFPELGIESSQRANLKCYKDYEALLTWYETEQIPNRIEVLTEVLELIETSCNIALMCFESDPEICHRNKLSNYLAHTFKGTISLVHL